MEMENDIDKISNFFFFSAILMLLAKQPSWINFMLHNTVFHFILFDFILYARCVDAYSK